MDIVVQADDCGIGIESTDRILDAGRKGRLDRVGVVANGNALPHAARRIAAMPPLGISVHLNLVEGAPVATCTSVPLLVGRDGAFRHTFLTLWLMHGLGARRELEEQVRQEIGAQIGRVRTLFAAPAVHLDSHQYVHLLPFVMGIIVRHAAEWGIRGVRTVHEPLFVVSSPRVILKSLLSANPLKLIILNWLSLRGIARLRRKGIACPEHSLGVAYSGAMSLAVVRRGIRCILRRGSLNSATLEIVFHPGRLQREELDAWAGKPAHRSFYCSPGRDAEARALGDRRFRELVQRAERGRGAMLEDGRPRTWIEYWDTESIFAPIMQRATRTFFLRSRTFMAWGSDDVVLDIGCGPGYLEDSLKDLVKEVHGVDTSPRLIGECRRRFSAYPHLHFHVLNPERYTDLSFLEGRRFTRFVCLSVVQYYREQREIAELIESVRRLAAPGALLLIADIPVHADPLGDAIDLLRAGVSERMLKVVFSFIARSRLSPYHHMRRSVRLLAWPLAELDRLVSSLGPEARIVREPLTFSRRRVHLLAKLNGARRSGGP